MAANSIIKMPALERRRSSNQSVAQHIEDLETVVGEAAITAIAENRSGIIECTGACCNLRQMNFYEGSIPFARSNILGQRVALNLTQSNPNTNTIRF